MKRFIKFGLVGISGFLVDVGVLYLFISFWDPYTSRAISFASAIFVTWLLNRNFTFKGTNLQLSLTFEFIAYFGLMFFGGAVNLLVYAVLTTTNFLVAQYPIFGVAAGSIAGLFVNFIISSRLFSKAIQHK